MELMMKRGLLVLLVISFVLLFLSRWMPITNPLLSTSTHNLTTECPETTGTDIVVKDVYNTSISHILFGIGGSIKTWASRKHYTDLWWKPNITRGFVWLDENPNKKEWPKNSPPYRVSENTGRFKYGSSTSNRIARIVLESYRLRLKNVRWFVMGDDDTVFFTENLVTVLAKYDHNQMYYIGGNSESVEQDMKHTYGLGYGGAGFAISYSLVTELVKRLDGCIDRYSYMHGSDERIGACLAEIGVPLTIELGFHQVDIREDPYGFLAAHPITPLVSLHHLDDVKPIFPTSANQIDSLKRLMAAYKLDPGRILQQSICHDLKRKWSVSVSWGYTVQVYPWLMSDKELGIAFQTFQTWTSRGNQPFTFNTRPMRPEPCDRPLVYFLDNANNDGVEENNRTLTSYKRFVPKPGEIDCNRDDFLSALALHTVNVTSPRMDPVEWSKAPRRQCCEITSPMDGEDNFIIHIRSKRCNF
ncbi:hypothetical protein C5167_030265 [Papaver somniferum]|uniref:uncharacterized protein LOC113329488 n=1 Tax=Papaver somniferum TaxID=3469 RepID=UPI000E705618|nr:uncharacterized protein LOC113329488 [Papaver somniferum]RZC86914.1 hypothetical protein C5167_030265 [Papaver somniferum]